MINGSKHSAILLAGAAIAFGLCQFTSPAPADAAPVLARPSNTASLVKRAQVFQRGRTPRYPYVYTRRPGGWSTYFGFVPYAKGDFEVQALQRVYPQTNWPPSMRAWTPQSGF